MLSPTLSRNHLVLGATLRWYGGGDGDPQSRTLHDPARFSCIWEVYQTYDFPLGGMAIYEAQYAMPSELYA
mgnify:CR=1 FL=1